MTKDISWHKSSSELIYMMMHSKHNTNAGVQRFTRNLEITHHRIRFAAQSLAISHHKGHFTGNYMICKQKLSRINALMKCVLKRQSCRASKKQVRLHFSEFKSHGNKSNKQCLSN